MFQLALDFFGKSFPGRDKKPEPLRPPEGTEPLTWKHGLKLQVLRRPQARRYLLRLQVDGTVRLVIPRRGSQAEALRFLGRSEGWLLKQVERWKERRHTRLPWGEGSSFLFRGEEVRLQVEEIAGSVRLSFSNEAISLPSPFPDYREPVLAYLRRMAEQELPPRTHQLAAQFGIAITRVTVRAQKTRWGSCSARGTISLNWRLIHAPPLVVDYLIIHELMHRREMNHSKRYWKLVEQACPHYREAEKWLKGRRLETM